MFNLRAPGNLRRWGFPARFKFHRAQTGARLRVASGTYVLAVAIRATETLRFNLFTEFTVGLNL